MILCLIVLFLIFLLLGFILPLVISLNNFRFIIFLALFILLMEIDFLIFILIDFLSRIPKSAKEIVSIIFFFLKGYYRNFFFNIS